MDNRAIVKWWLASVLGLSVAGAPSAYAQSSIGGAKAPPPKIGGIAKPAPVVGGAPYHPPTFVAPKPSPTIGMTKPNTVGGVTTPAATGNTTRVATGNAMVPAPTASTAGNVRPNPPAMTTPKPVTVTTTATTNKGGPNKGAKVANLKCAAGACMARGKKP